MKKINLEKHKTLAERYTKALWNIAQEKDNVQKFSEELNSIVNILEQNPDISGFFVNPAIKKEDKKDVLYKSFNGKIDNELYNFLNIMIDKNRLYLLPNIEYLYNKRISEAANILDIEAVTAIELDDELQNALQSRLEKITGKNIRITNAVTPSIIGGVILKCRGNVIDGSILTQLKSLQKQLI